MKIIKILSQAFTICNYKHLFKIPDLLKRAVGYYPLTSETNASDESPLRNPPGTIADSAFLSHGVCGEAGGSYSFSGSRSAPSYIRLPKSSNLDTR